MTAHVEYELRCDGAPGMGPFDCPTRAIFDKTAKAARAEAAQHGWVSGYRDRKRVDLCPDHKQDFTHRRRRGTCTGCGLERSLTMLGDVIGAHQGKKLPGQRWVDWCPGSHKPPLEHTAMAALTPDDPALPAEVER